MSIRRMTLGSGLPVPDGLGRPRRRRWPDGVAADRLLHAGGHPAAAGSSGRGLAGLDAGSGIAPGSVVTEEQLWRMLGMLQDPATGAPLGRPPGASRTAYVDGLGRARKAPKTVAGFDLTFSAPKSVSVAWALADEPTRARIRAAHQAALEFVIGYAEERVFATRTGRGGVVSDDVRGVVAAAFEHWDSRAGDPQLHTHVVVLNRVQAVSDGGWRTLDSKALFRAAVGLSELYNGVLSDLVTADLGYGLGAGGPAPFRRWRSGRSPGSGRRCGRSSRSAAPRSRPPRTSSSSSSWPRTGGSRPRRRCSSCGSRRPWRPARTSTSTPLSELVAGWRKRAAPYVGEEPEAWVASLAGRNDLPLLHAGDLSEGILADAARVAVTVVVGQARHVHPRQRVRRGAAPDRRGPVRRPGRAGGRRRARVRPRAGPVAAADPARHRCRPRRVASPGRVLAGSAPATRSCSRRPSCSTRRSGSSRPGGPPTGPPCRRRRPPLWWRRTLPGREHPLSADQADAVCRVLTSGRVLDVLVGPAGTGKSTAMAGVRAAWEASVRAGVGGRVGAVRGRRGGPRRRGRGADREHREVARRSRPGRPIGAPSSSDCRLGWTGPARRCAPAPSCIGRGRSAAEVDRWRLRPGQLVIVDEASMAGTFELDSLTAHARAAGAKVLLVGDWAQLSPVAAGGAFKLLATDRDDAPQLLDVRRFRHEWERDASLGLRAGRPTAAAAYVAQGRVEGGDRESMLDVLFEAWRADTRAGRRSLMMAADAQTVADLNARARADRVATGDVTAHGVRVADGSTLGVGDVVVTRLNQRALAAVRRPGSRTATSGSSPPSTTTGPCTSGVLPAGEWRCCLPRMSGSTSSSGTRPPRTARRAGRSTRRTRSSPRPRSASRST